MPMNLPRPPVCIDIPYVEDSAVLFERIRHLSWPVMLDSANTGDNAGRYDIFCADPFIRIQTQADITEIQTGAGTQQSADDPFLLLQQTLSRYQTSPCFLPFAGGAVGYFAYDLGRRLESIPQIAHDAEQIPDLAVGIYDWAVVVDHHQRQCFLASFLMDEQTQHKLTAITSWLQQDNAAPPAAFNVTGAIRSNLSKTDYTAAFDKIQHYITEGDCYQVNLAKRFEVNASGDAWHAYKILRKQNAAPFSAYFSTPAVTLLSSSPERLLSVRNGHVETKPIKGTRPRDLSNTVRDKALADELKSSIKDRAENLMIVDLLRNDLGKVCRPGSIDVPHSFVIESFATVHHLVSTITGELADSESAVALLRACFPGGSITGAPKLRAMEIIEELEPNRRGVYCGSIGYIGFDGNMDTNITIRTLVYSDQRLRFWAGGGIVKDSDALAEHQEVLDKAAAMFRLIDDLRKQ